VRSSGRPFFLVLNTYRYSPHSKGDDNRDPAEIDAARQRDPLGVAGARLPEDERTTIEEACERRLTEAIAAADASPPAVPESG
jgi:2-oxoisovalerate dehydrogenase E1 component